MVMSKETGFPSASTYSRRPLGLSPMRPRHERVEHASIDEEFAGPASLRVRRIADGYVNADRAYCGSPSELVLLPCLNHSAILFTMQGIAMPRVNPFETFRFLSFPPRRFLFFCYREPGKKVPDSS